MSQKRMSIPDDNFKSSSSVSSQKCGSTSEKMKRVPGRLLRRETTSRLLDLSKPLSAMGTMATMSRATSSEPASTCNAAPGPGSTPAAAPAAQGGARSGKISWKSPKMFSRTMTTADLLKGIKKLSIPATVSSEDNPDAAVKLESKSLKTRLSSSLRRKSSSSGLNPSAGAAATGTSSFSSSVVAAQDLVQIKVDFEDESSSSSSFGGGGASSSLGPFYGTSSTPPRKKSEDEGIVCKREDLISLINKVNKNSGHHQVRSSSFEGDEPTLVEPQSSYYSGDSSSPGTSRENSQSCSLETKGETKENVSVVVSSFGRKESSIILPPLLLLPNQQFDLPKQRESPSPVVKSPTITRSPTTKSPGTQNCPLEIEPVSFFEKTVKDEKEKSTLLNSEEETKMKEGRKEARKEGGGSTSEVSKVQWDDGTDVNAMLLGGAIEAFLKGISGGGGGGGANTEKRVSFKKN